LQTEDEKDKLMDGAKKLMKLAADVEKSRAASDDFPSMTMTAD
jgi:hypothetical protein